MRIPFISSALLELKTNAEWNLRGDTYDGLEWLDKNQVQANFFPFMELNDQTCVSISGLSSSIVNLTDSFNVGVKTDFIGLAKTMTIGSAG